jgi:EAL domain-containing protein (putative c-di-GMP-specific phosphodiesterase class I)
MPFRERDRLFALHQTGLLDSDPEAVFDTAVELAASLFDAPMAAVSLVDDRRQWFKAKVGLTKTGSDRSESLCAVAVDENRALLVSDARVDARFAHLPDVRAGNFVSYFGVPIAGRDGLPLGTLCVLDVLPRSFDPAKIGVLRSLARMVGNELDARRRDTLAGLDPMTARENGAALREALDSDELRVFYQPIVDLRNGDVHSLEALVRWQHPVRGLLPPAAFLPLAEATGLDHPIDRWVLRSAATTAAHWRKSLPGLENVQVAVNVGLSPAINGAWADEVFQLLADTGLPAAALTIEVTERSMDEVVPGTATALARLVAAGAQLSIDDIGTGTSSLVRLADLPVTQVKIDGSFVRTMAGNRRRTAVVSAVARLGHELGLDVVAEGVEDAPTAALAIHAGCTLAQGYLWSPPVASAEVPALLLGWPKLSEDPSARTAV